VDYLVQNVRSGILTCLLFVVFISGTIPSNLAITSLIVAALFMAPFGGTYRINYRFILYISILFLTFFYFYYRGVFVYAAAEDEISQSVKSRLTWSLFYIPAFFFIAVFYRNVSVAAVRHTLIIFVGFWYLQTFVSYATGEYFDIWKILGFREQKAEAYFIKGIDLGFKLWRPTSFLNEPGTYASIVFLLLVADYINCEYRITKTHLFTLSSFILSMSGFGFALAVVFSLGVVLSKKQASAGKSIFTTFAFLVVCCIAYLYYDFRSGFGDRAAGFEFRFVLIAKYATGTLQELIFGHSLDDTIIAAGKFGIMDAFVEDLSFAFYLNYHFGIIGFFLMIFYLLMFSNYKSSVFLILFLFPKIHIGAYALWMIISIIKVNQIIPRILK